MALIRPVFLLLPLSSPSPSPPSQPPSMPPMPLRPRHRLGTREHRPRRGLRGGDRPADVRERHGRGECSSAEIGEDDDDDDATVEATDAEEGANVSRRGLAGAYPAGRTRFISYGALTKNRVPCSQRGHSYYNCRRRRRANPYRRGCSVITHCAGNLH
uniref:Protein RALF-like 19 n=1 Tax=Ananas comosus var. bracteatus TaxID=296719 RepID=A0A6V7QJA1_ANACO|nr:unnamed protein product [Ananas comosus var. bracteatus]